MIILIVFVGIYTDNTLLEPGKINGKTHLFFTQQFQPQADKLMQMNWKSDTETVKTSFIQTSHANKNCVGKIF